MYLSKLPDPRGAGPEFFFSNIEANGCISVYVLRSAHYQIMILLEWDNAGHSVRPEFWFSKLA